MRMCGMWSIDNVSSLRGHSTPRVRGGRPTAAQHSQVTASHATGGNQVLSSCISPHTLTLPHIPTLTSSHSHTSHTLYSHSHTSSHPHTPYISTLTLPHTPTLTSHSHISSHSHHLTLTHLIFPLSHLTPSHTLTHPTQGGGGEVPGGGSRGNGATGDSSCFYQA